MRNRFADGVVGGVLGPMRLLGPLDGALLSGGGDGMAGDSGGVRACGGSARFDKETIARQTSDIINVAWSVCDGIEGGEV